MHLEELLSVGGRLGAEFGKYFADQFDFIRPSGISLLEAICPLMMSVSYN